MNSTATRTIEALRHASERFRFASANLEVRSDWSAGNAIGIGLAWLDSASYDAVADGSANRSVREWHDALLARLQTASDALASASKGQSPARRRDLLAELNRASAVTDALADGIEVAEAIRPLATA